MIYLHFKWGGGYSKSEVDTLLNGKADSSHTHSKSQITDFPSYGTTANTICEGNDSRLSDARTPTSHTHTKSEITDFPSLSTVATSGSYNDLSNKPTIPTVNNAALKIQKNGADVKTFTANASSDVTCNITVPTKVSELTNDAGFLTSHQSLSNYSTLANTVKSLSISGKTITVTPGSGNAYTLTTQDTTYTHPTSSGNKHIPSGGSSGQFLGWSADGTAKWVNNPNTNTWTAMVGATSSSNGSVGYVNAVPPKDGYNTKYLRADGTWQVPPDHTYTVNNATLTIQKNGTTVKTFTANASSNVTCNITVPTKTSDLTNDNRYTSSLNSSNSINFDWNSTYSNKVGIKIDNTWLGGILTTANTTIPSKTSQLTNDSCVPVAGGAIMTGDFLGRTVNNSHLAFSGGIGWDYGANVSLYGKDSSTNAGVCLIRVKDNTNDTIIAFYPSGNFLFGSNFALNNDTTFRIGSTSGLYSLFRYDGVIWNNSERFIPLNNLTMNLGGAGNSWKDCFLLNAPVVVSDSRAKTQVQDVDDKLLDAWENVSPKTFKMVSAVEKKGVQARFHTGYIAQDIEKACTDNNIDATRYGLFCFDSWDEQPEVTEDVEVEKDGVKTTETRIVQEKRAKGDSYSLRYEEALVVECAYLRRENTRLTTRLNSLESRLEQLEQSFK